MSNGRQYHQDIYQRDESKKDDYSPQISSEAAEERQRELRRHQLAGFALGASVLIVLVSLVIVIVRYQLNINSAEEEEIAAVHNYIPRHSLPFEEQWVLDFPDSFSSPKEDGESSPLFNSKWLKKAAYNLIMAEQSARIGNQQAAAEFYENALEIFPDIEGVKIQLGMTYFRLKEYEKALSLLEDIPEANLTEEVLNNLGAACMHADAYERAESYFTKALEISPTYANAIRNMAYLYQKQKREEECINTFKKYLDQRPNDLDVKHDLALYLTQLGHWEDASEQLNELTEEITNVPALYFLLAQAEKNNNNLEAAMDALARGMQLTDPNAPLKWMDKEEFEALRKSDQFNSIMKNIENEDDEANDSPGI